jgi:hypothetical protein
VIKDRLTRSSPWFTSFFLSHDNLRVGERGFDQVVTQLHQFTRPIYQHAIGMFNACSRGATHRSLTDTGRVYNLGGASFPHHTLRPFQPTVSTFHLWVMPSLRLFIQSLPTELKGEQTLNLMSGSLHSTSTATYYLSIVLLMVNHQEIGLIRVIRKVAHNVTRLSSNSYRLNAQSSKT